MKLREIFRFELAYQVRRVSTWLYFAVLLVVVAFSLIRGNYISGARNGDYFLNAPFIIVEITIVCSLLWLLVAAAVAGDAAARDVETRMHPLTYTAPVSKADYLGGRFLAALVLNALILLAVLAGILLAVHSPGVEAEILGPFRPAAYLSAYVFIALPNAFLATAIQFSFAALSRRAIASYLGGILLVVTAFVIPEIVAGPYGLQELGQAAGSIRRRHPGRYGGCMDTDREEYAPDRAGWHAALEPPPVDRHRPGHARIHLHPLSLESSYRDHVVESHDATTRRARPDACGHRVREEHWDLRVAGPADVRLRNPRTPDARHRADIVPGDPDELGAARPPDGCRDTRGSLSARGYAPHGRSAAP